MSFCNFPNSHIFCFQWYSELSEWPFLMTLLLNCRFYCARLLPLSIYLLFPLIDLLLSYSTVWSSVLNDQVQLPFDLLNFSWINSKYFKRHESCWMSWKINITPTALVLSETENYDISTAKFSSLKFCLKYLMHLMRL